MKHLQVQPGGCLQGELRVPGDKSITHRAIIIAGIMRKDCESIIQNWSINLDCLATVNALQALGVQVNIQPDVLQIKSVGLHGLQKPKAAINIGNSGTTMRLLTGVLCAQKFSSCITGDASICKRPMRRIILPLMQMGAKIAAIADEYAPLTIMGGQTLQAINYTMPIASAQVKSAILLASLYAAVPAIVTAPQICRDHTELMLRYFWALSAGDKQITLQIPGDLSSAAFFMVGAVIAPGSDILLRGIGLNPTRTAVIDILRNMGADIALSNCITLHNEPRADIRVRYTKKLQAACIPQHLVANAIDELPALCLAAACANGTTVIRGAEELRYKESDRIALLAHNLSTLGITVSEFRDGLAITGGILSGGEVRSGGDHRIAMTFIMAGLVAQQEIIVQDTDNIATSFPGFVAVAQESGMQIAPVDSLVC